MKRLVAYGQRVTDHQIVKGTLVKVPVDGELKYYIRYDLGFDEVIPGSVYDVIEEE